MRKSRKIAAAAMAAVMMCTLWGCGNSGGGSRYRDNCRRWSGSRYNGGKSRGRQRRQDETHHGSVER